MTFAHYSILHQMREHNFNVGTYAVSENLISVFMCCIFTLKAGKTDFFREVTKYIENSDLSDCQFREFHAISYPIPF